MSKKLKKPNSDIVSLLLRNIRTLKKYLALHFHLSALREIEFLFYVRSYSKIGYSTKENRAFLNSNFKKTDDLFMDLYGKGFIVKNEINHKYYVSNAFEKMTSKLLKWVMEDNITMPLHTSEMIDTFKNTDTRLNNYKRVFQYLNKKNEAPTL